jgi:hypothetical protein
MLRMKMIFWDAETFYSKEYSLRHMDPASYILDPRFELICVSAQVDDGPIQFIDGPDFATWLKQFDPADTIMVAFNSNFDQAIAAWRYHFIPARMIDVLGLARALLGHKLRRLSLDAVGKHLGAGDKGTVLQSVVGMHRQDIINSGLWPSYQAYNAQDVRIMRTVFNTLAPSFPKAEFRLLDLVLRCCVEPRFVADVPRLEAHLTKVRLEKEALINASGFDKETLASTDGFARALEGLGVEVQTKISKTGNEIPALAKTDDFLNDLLEHDDPMVQAAAAARLGVKSTLEEARTARMIKIAKLDWSIAGLPACTMPIPLRYAGAHTQRLSGEWKINMQNLPSGRDGKDPALRLSLLAPPGYECVVGDLAQVEARITAWFTRATVLLEAFARGEDVYKVMAAEIFGITVAQITDIQRFVGKECLGADTLVLTNKGFIRIRDVQSWHKLWDGTEWVGHEGLIQNGPKPTVQLCGLSLTPDHLVLSGGWCRASKLADKNIRSQALAVGAASLPLRDICARIIRDKDFRRSLFSADVGGQSIPLIAITFTILKVRAAAFVREIKRLVQENYIGDMRIFFPMMNIVNGFSIVFPLALPDATTPATNIFTITEGAASLFISHGEQIDANGLPTSSRCQGGIIRIWIWIEQITIKATSLAICGLRRMLKMQPIKDKSVRCKSELLTLKPVYDLANAGPRQRFTILTNEGPIIVHNCVLGLGFGLAATNFHSKTGAKARSLGLDLGDLWTLQLAKDTVRKYRQVNSGTVTTWELLEQHLHGVWSGLNDEWAILGPVSIGPGCIEGPGGLRMLYETEVERAPGRDLWYSYGGKPRKIYGAACLENIVQFLARIVQMNAALRLAQRGLRMVHTVHDELVFIVPKKDVDETKRIVLEEMVRRPSWAPTLPLKAEVGSGLSYGESK